MIRIVWIILIVVTVTLIACDLLGIAHDWIQPLDYYHYR